MKQPKNIPEDINAEELLAYFPEGQCKVSLHGLHKRNAYNDIVSLEEEKDGALLMGLGRNSLYNALPEMMFHPTERFGNISKMEDKERFKAEYQKQEQEKEDAYRFFAPLDLLLLDMRVKIRKRLVAYVEEDKVLIDILCDRLTKEQRANRFIGHALQFMPLCRTIRGDRTFLTLMLRKIFMEEGLKMNVHQKTMTYTDKHPRYADGLDADMGESYIGNVFEEETTIYDIQYWSDDDCNDNFLRFVDEVEMFRRFMQDYFISIEETLHFDISRDEASLRLSDDIACNYLNYNTNL